MTDRKTTKLDKAYTSFIDLMLSSNDPVDQLDSLAMKDVMGYGTTLDEKIHNLKGLKDLANLQREQSANMKFKYALNPVFRKVMNQEKTAVIVDEIHISMLTKGEKIELQMRLSTVLDFIDGNWRVVHWHGSKPEYDSEGSDTWHKEELNKKNEELQKLVDEKTDDLANKNRELEIEASLERIRAIAMSMQKAEGLLDVVEILSTELKKLGFKDIRNTIINIFNDSEEKFLNYDYSDYGVGGISEVDYNSHPSNKKFVNKMRKASNEFMITEFTGKELNEWRKWRIDQGQMPDPKLDQAKSLYYYEFSIGVGSIGISTFSPINSDQLKIFNKIRNVFDLAYRRYSDIEQAEAHAREAQIESSLDRVRASMMAMHQTSELQDVINDVHQQFQGLNMDITGGVFIAINKEIDKEILCWGAGGTADYIQRVHIPFLNRPIYTEIVKGIKKGPGFFSEEFTYEEKIEFFKHLFKNPPYNKAPASQKKEVMGRQGGYTRSTVVSKHTSIFIINHHGRKFSDADNDILKRFGKVFEQTYTRFLDLQKAEEQAREAQIEAALERVRSKSNAMQRSEQLSETAAVMFQQLCSLGQVPDRLGIVIYNEQQQIFESWTTDQSGLQLTKAFNASRKEPTTFSKIYKAWKENKDLIIIDLTGQQLKNWLRFVKENMKLPIKESNIKNRRVHYNAFFSHGCLMCTFHEPSEYNFNQLLVRFAKVFDQTYTRFLDLQKAEAQTREAQIEAALERVRSRSLAMHTTDELGEVVVTLVEKLKDLGVVLDANGVVLCTYFQESKDVMHWIASPDFSFAGSYLLPYFKHPIFDDAWKSKESGTEYFSKAYSVEKKNSFFEYAFKHSDYKKFPDDFKQWVFQNDKHILSFAWQKNSAILIPSHTGVLPSEDDVEILKRFAKVFEQSYVRFLDLQKAEAQAREAQIEAALEKVRSRSIGMQKSEELKEVIQVIHDQLIHLNFKIDAAGFTMDYFQNNDWNIWIANKEQSLPTQIYIPFIDHPQFNYYKRAKEKGLDFFANTLSYDDKNSIFNYMFEFMGDYPQAERDQVLNAPGLAISQAFLKNITLWIYNLDGNPYTVEDNDILMRFARVFEQTYVRFNDLQKAEKQAREAQIELSLERIRAQVTAMSESAELLDIVVTMRTEFVALGHEAHYFWYMRYHPETYEKAMTSGDGTRIGMVMSLPRHIHGDIKLIDDWEKSDEPTVVFAMDVETAVDYIHKMITLGDFKQVDPNAPTLDDIRHIGGLTFIMARTTHGEIGYSLPGVVANPPKEDLNILVRFAGVFDLAYRRFEDLKRSEQQNRETQIELALERVRAKTMAMHNSHDMGITVETLFGQVLKLGLDNDIRCGIGILEGTVRMETRSATLDLNGEVDLKIGMLDMTIHPLLKRIKNGWERGETHYVDQMSGKDVVKYYSALNNEPDYPFLRDLKTLPKIEYHNSFSFPEGIIFAFSPNPMTEEAAQVFERFARVFGQTYRRYRDLLKAEEQARESQIEAALERVRSKAMAMHSSEDLGLTVDTFFAELKGLNVSPHRCGLGIIDKETKIVNVQAIDTNGGKHIKKVVGDLKLSGHPVLDKIFENWQLQKEYFPVLRGKEIMEYYNVMNPQVKFHEFADDEVQYGYYFYFKEGGVYAWTDSELPERDLQIFRRYSSVLSLTYRRYLDLKEAEAQAREAKIEASLERIRSKALSMQKSTEVGEVNDLLFEEFENMGIEMVGCGISVINEETDQCEQWRARQVAAVNSFEPYSFKESIRILTKYIPDFMSKLLPAWKAGDPFFNWYVEGKKRKAYINGVAKLFNYDKNQQKEILAAYPESYNVNFIFYKRGWLSLSTIKSLTEYEINFSRRFVEAFDFAHTRFLDLQKSEAQAKDAIKQASLDRVRGQIASMRSTEDLQRITPLIWSELETLGVPFIRCGVFIIDEIRNNIQVYLTTSDGKPIGALNLPLEANNIIYKIVEHWKKKKVFSQHWNKEDFINWMQSMIKLGQVKSKKAYQGNVAPPESLDLNFIPFTQGMLYVGNIQPLSTEKIDLVKSLAKAFSVAYARYEDFKQLEIAKNEIENTFNDLKATQNQLIQAEKMASLGELTAGIAHEIQNPLNFVNNFSEVNSELIEELIEEIDNKEWEEVKAIANDISGNEEKIKHHGKRADDIVKGMLQHSRTTNNEKEPIDINLLADEYLRLSYHGLRAKDKSFNADFKANLDDSLPKINVIPQDIGRVLLNLINNAFYACTERIRSASASDDRDYKPQVIVTTKKLDNKIQIIVQDNGTGIPDEMTEKIFQPFFTTKPTGEGTGLGLSLSYDIITKGHGGTLDVETNEGEGLPSEKTGTSFIIQLPII